MRIKLNAFQKLKYYIASYGDYIVFSIGILESKHDQALTEAIVQKALKFMQNRHPHLRGHIQHDLDSPEDDVYLVIDDINYKPIDLEWSIVSCREVMMTEMELFNSELMRFKDRCSIARVKVVEFTEHNSTLFSLSFRTIPVISDGINIVAILTDLMNIINALIEGTECFEMTETLDLGDNMHTRLEKQGFITDEMRQKVDDILARRAESSRQKFLLPKQFASLNETGFKLNTLKINPQQTQQLMNRSKEKGFKLTVPINTIVVTALRQLYIEHGLEFPKEVSLSFPLNMRWRYDPPLDLSDMSYQVVAFRFDLTYERSVEQFDNFWQHAEFMNAAMKEQVDLNKGFLFTNTHNFSAIDSMNKICRESLAKSNFDGFDSAACEEPSRQKGYDLGISNIGSWVYKNKKVNKGAFELNEVYFGDSVATAPCFGIPCIVFINFWNQELDILVCSNKHAFGSVYANRFTELIQACFLKATSE
jgi:hypothetical protein